MPSKYQRKRRERTPFRKIVIATECVYTEPKYFDAARQVFRTPALKIEIIERADDAGYSAPRYVLEQLNIFKNKGSFVETDELWMVIDKDRWSDEQLSEVAAECQRKNYHLAVSNPCFELWIVLHLDNLSVCDARTLQGLCNVDAIKQKRGELYAIHRVGSYEDLTKAVGTAITNARNLDVNPVDRWPNQLGTHVYKLAESIIAAS